MRAGTLGAWHVARAPTYFPYGRYRRRIRVVATAHRVSSRAGSRTTSTTSPSRCTTTAQQVVSVTSASVRAPWSTCADAAAPLRDARRHAAVRPLPGGDGMDRVGAALHAPARPRRSRGRARGAGRRRRCARRPPVRRRDPVRAARRRGAHRHARPRRRASASRWVVRGGTIVAPQPVRRRAPRVRTLGRRHPRRPTTPRRPWCSGGRAASG